MTTRPARRRPARRRPARQPRAAVRVEPVVRRSGLTLLETLAASAVIAAALTPALRITRAALLTADRLDRQERCLTVANDRLESLLVRAAADWDATVTGAATDAGAAAPGYPGLRASDLATDAAGAGGIPGRLAALSVLAWYDDDGDGVADPDEPRATLATALARLTAYERHAHP